MKEIPIFAIITDFGFDFAVASMKAVILKKFPQAQIIDIDHSIKHFSILSGAFVINKIYKFFPDETIFICVIDPGVGSSREIVCIDTGKHKFVGPNNGIFHYVARNLNKESCVYVVRSNFNPIHSNTFHGRDIITPIAIELAHNNFSSLILRNKNIIRNISLLDDSSCVVYIDSFGNIKTNIPAQNITSDKCTVKVKDKQYVAKIAKTFSDVESGELLCYEGSSGVFELAVNLGSAADKLMVNIGDPLIIDF